MMMKLNHRKPNMIHHEPISALYLVEYALAYENENFPYSSENRASLSF